MTKIVCRPRTLSPAQEDRAVRRSIEINPRNADERREIMRTPAGRRGGPRRLAVVIGHKWPETGVRLTVQFLDSPPRDLRKRLLEHMNAWSKTANVRFEETSGTGLVRLARLKEPVDLSGYWSFVGTEILGIEDDQPTMNLEGFTMRTPESEFKRVVRHEAGHTLGFDHEHMRAALIKKIDRRKAIAYFDRTEGWTPQETVEQVLTPLSKKTIMGTAEVDPLSIMCYQIPGAITKDGKAIPGGKDITAKDFAFAGKLYPIPATGVAPPLPGRARETEAVAEAPAAAPAPPVLPAAAEPIVDSDTFHVVIMDPGRLNPDRPAQARSSPEFAAVVATYGGARVALPMRLRRPRQGGPRTLFPEIIKTHERIKHYTNREKGSLPDEKGMIAFGSQLFDTLFHGDVKRLYDEARSRQHGRKLDFVFTSMVPWIAEKPWEFAYDQARNTFLATEDIHFIRNVLTAIPADVIPPRRGPLRILVASAQPAGFGRLSIEQEEKVIRRGFEALIDAGLAVVEVLPRATPSSIHARLSTGGYNVVHFIGHGTFDEESQEGFLVFENDRGRESRLGERSVREIFCQRGVTLVFLNACQTGSGGRADFNKGVAQSLVSHGLPALVANQYSVLDSSATSFAQHFYWALAQGMSIGQAAREARIAVNYSLEGEVIDWAVPVVYARDPGMRICVKPEKPVPPPSAATRARGRRAVEARPFEMAVWDIDNVFPSLGDTLDRMNACQERFGFDLVDLSAPVDAWDLEQKSPDDTPYLDAEQLAHRLGRMPLELHVNVLACVTRHWMRGDGESDIYCWWSETGESPVMVFSVAGFDALAPAGAETDRAIANVLVAALSGYLGRMDTHRRGPQTCPMATNDRRSLKVMVGSQAFDRDCRAKLARKLPKDLPALEALLQVFR
jgi:hypothetical protein